MGVSTTVGCRKLTSHWSPMCGGQKLQTYIYIYSAATGGITNLAKSESVLLGSWRSLKPDVGVRTVTASKYLGVITGDDKALSKKAMLDRIAKVHAQLDM